MHTHYTLFFLQILTLWDEYTLPLIHREQIHPTIKSTAFLFMHQ